VGTSFPQLLSVEAQQFIRKYDKYALRGLTGNNGVGEMSYISLGKLMITVT